MAIRAGQRLRVTLLSNLNGRFVRHQSGQAQAPSVAAEAGSTGRASSLFLPGATVATLLMLGTLHARRLYEDSKAEEARRQGKELEFEPDWKASFLQLLPLRFISRSWGSLTSMELPIWARPYVYKGWARAFNSNLEEASQPVEEYVSLRDFFTRGLKEGVRPLALGPACLLSPVDGVVVRCGKVRGSGTMIEQVKGFSYSVSALLGATPPPLALAFSEAKSEQREDNAHTEILPETGKRRWGSLWSRTKSLEPTVSDRSAKDLFYCVLYLGPGDYHRIHSPTDWQIFQRRHFAGRLYPVNQRAVRSIKDLYVVNERVVLEGKWSQGLMAMAAVGATNVGSIELKFEPELKTNQPITGLKDLQSIVSTRTYGEGGTGLFVKGGEEVAVFNLGSTVVLVFQAPASSFHDNKNLSPSETSEGFRFVVENGQRVKMGQAIGRW